MTPLNKTIVFLAAALLALPGWSRDLPPIINYASLAQPVWAANGMVSSQEAKATRIGVEILKQGGNAVDAAVAVGFALAVTLPRAGNLGGGGFMLVHLAESKQTIAIDYREIAPAAANRDMFLDDQGNADPQKSRYSGLAVGIPGTVKGLLRALNDHGSMSLSRVMRPAIRLASRGFRVSHDLSRSLQRAAPRLQQNPAARSVFYHADGSALKSGELLLQPDLAHTLQRISASGSDGFYRGSVAGSIVEAVNAEGGRFTLQDMADYRVKIRQPVFGEYRGYRIASMPPPSSGGTHIVQILNMLEHFDLARSGAHSADTIHLMAEAMKRAYADRSRYLGDPDFVDVPVTDLTAKDYAARLVAGIDRVNASDSRNIAPGLNLPRESPQTTHFSVVDRWGNAVSITYTLNFSYGSGLMAPRTGVLLNNELDDFSAKPGVANAYGLIGGAANAVAGGKRPLSSMSPTIVFDKASNEVLLVTGSPGGSRIITTTLQIISNVIDHGMNIAEATHAPRFHHQWLPDKLVLEKGFSPDTLRLLQSRGHQIDPSSWAMGSTQSIMRSTEGGWFGASDPRQSGTLSAGY